MLSWRQSYFSLARGVKNQLSVCLSVCSHVSKYLVISDHVRYYYYSDFAFYFFIVWFALVASNKYYIVCTCTLYSVCGVDRTIWWIMVRSLDLRLRGRQSNFRPLHFQLTTSGKLFTRTCLCN